MQSGYPEGDDGLFDAANDNISVVFEKNILNNFQWIYEKLENWRSDDVIIDSAVAKLRVISWKITVSGGKQADKHNEVMEWNQSREVADDWMYVCSWGCYSSSSVTDIVMSN